MTPEAEGTDREGEGGAQRAALDDAALRASIDRGGMLEAIASLPVQLRSAASRAGSVRLTGIPVSGPRAVLVLGMGGSAIGADLVRASFAGALRAPLLVHREPDLPAWVGPGTLVIASSHSGRTEETLAAFRSAMERGAAGVAITTGGELAALASAAGAPVIRFEAPGQPRAAVGHAAGLLVAVLAAAGVLDADPVAELEGAARSIEVELAANGPEVGLESNGAKRLAVTLADRLPVVVGSGHLQAVAHRWRTQLNENAKVWAGWDELPELNHNAVVGFGGPRWTCERLFVVALAAEDEQRRVGERRDAALDLLRESGTPGTVLVLRAAAPFAQAFAGVVVGDLVSVYLALLRGVDPTPVDAIARLKVRLSTGPTGP